MSNPSENKGKYNISFNQPTIGHQHIGDVNTTEYRPKVTMTATITIDNRYVKDIPKPYADSLQEFAALLNREFKKQEVPPAVGAPIQTKVNELSEEAMKLKGEGIEGGGRSIDENKKKGIHGKLKALATALAKASPSIARTIIGFTPLAPFSELIGDTFEEMVQSALVSS
jgi:hypothetical protein